MRSANKSSQGGVPATCLAGRSTRRDGTVVGLMDTLWWLRRPLSRLCSGTAACRGKQIDLGHTLPYGHFQYLCTAMKISSPLRFLLLVFLDAKVARPFDKS